MAFSDLPLTLQNITMAKFDFGVKLGLILLMVLICWYYKETFDPKKESPYLMVRALRGFIYLTCCISLSMSPLMVFLLFPQISLDHILTILIFTYSMAIMFGGIIISFNVLQYGFGFVFNLLGMDDQGKSKKMQEGMEFITGKQKV